MRRIPGSVVGVPLLFLAFYAADSRVSIQYAWAAGPQPSHSGEVVLVSQTDGPTLQEALDFMNDTIPREGVITYSTGSHERTGFDFAAVTFTYERSVSEVSAEQCSLAWHETITQTRFQRNMSIGLPVRDQNQKSQMQYRVSLGGLDPSHVHIIEWTPDIGTLKKSNEGPFWALTLHAAAGAAAIKVAGSKSTLDRVRDRKNENTTFRSIPAQTNTVTVDEMPASAAIVMNDKEMTQRISRALQHAIKLCSGK